MNKLNSEQRKFLEWLRDVDLNLVSDIPSDDAEFLWSILSYNEYTCISKILKKGEYEDNNNMLSDILNRCKRNKTLTKYWKLYTNTN